MIKKIIFLILLPYLVVHFLFYPTYEVSKGFDTVNQEFENFNLMIRLSGERTETGSRILNRSYETGPYLLQLGITQVATYYTHARIQSFIIYKHEINSPVYQEKHVALKGFEERGELPSIVGYSKDNIELDYQDYYFKVNIELCDEKGCEVLEKTGVLNFSIKKKFYSNTFAAMMSI